MIVVGVAFVVFWALLSVFSIPVAVAAATTGVAFILFGLVLGERPWNRQ